MNNPSRKQGNSKPLLAILLAALVLAAFAGSALAAKLVKNGSFEKDSNGDGIPNGWLVNPGVTAADKRVCNQSYAGNCSFKTVADGSTESIYQDLAIQGTTGDKFKVSVWVKGKTLDIGSGQARFYLVFNHVGPGTNFVWAGVNPGTYTWQLRQATGAASSNFDSITIFLYLEGVESGKVWIDKVKLIEVEP
jgi:hypothetical protein